MHEPGNARPPKRPAPSSAPPRTDLTQAMADVNQALLAMRDALTQLSLALKDWQFDHDLSRRANAHDITRGLLANLVHPTRPDTAKPPGINTLRS